MKRTTIGKFCKGYKQFLDDVFNNSEELVIRRQGGKDVVLISLNEYNSMKETLYLLSTEANSKHIGKSLNEIEQGRTEKVDTENLWK